VTGRDALELISAVYPHVFTEPYGARFVNEVVSIMWHRYPWRQSLEDLPPFYLIDGQAEVYAPLVNIPTDFHGLHEVWLQHYGGDTEPIEITANLSKYNVYGKPEAICYLPEKSGFRLWPIPSGYNPPYWWVAGTYKKKPTEITNENLASQELPFDDIYAHVIRQGLLWKFKQEIIQSPEADSEFTKFLIMLRDMAATEGLVAGPVVIHPEEDLRYG